MQVNSCNVNTMNSQLDKKASLKAKYPRVFERLGRLKGFRLKLHTDQSVKPVSQPLDRIPFSRRQKVNEKLGQLVVFFTPQVYNYYKSHILTHPEQSQVQRANFLPTDPK